jgi:SAM-dependent methyltransferase
MKPPEHELRASVREAYSAAAQQPQDRHAFPVGRSFAESLGYSRQLLDTLPQVSSEAFAGVSNVSLFAEIGPGASVLDLGCGAGLDSLVAARRAGEAGHVVGIDFSEPMLARARCAALEARTRNVLFCRASAESLPLRDDSVDVALVNGIFNLNPARTAIFGELARALRPGGAVYAAELILLDPLPEDQRNPANWFA